MGKEQDKNHSHEAGTVTKGATQKLKQQLQYSYRTCSDGQLEKSKENEN